MRAYHRYYRNGAQHRQTPTHDTPARPTLYPSRPNRAHNRACPKSHVEKRKGLGIAARGAEHVRMFLHACSNDVADLGAHRSHYESEKDTDEKEQTGEKDFGMPRGVRAQKEKRNGRGGKSKAESGNIARSEPVG